MWHNGCGLHGGTCVAPPPRSARPIRASYGASAPAVSSSHRQTQPVSTRRRIESIPASNPTMADGGEGEDEIQFLRTVSSVHGPLRPSVAAEVDVIASFCSGVCVCVSACVSASAGARARSVGREFTALRMTAPVDSSRWSMNPHHANRGLQGCKRCADILSESRTGGDMVFVVACVAIVLS